MRGSVYGKTWLGMKEEQIPLWNWLSRIFVLLDWAWQVKDNSLQKRRKHFLYLVRFTTKTLKFKLDKRKITKSESFSCMHMIAFTEKKWRPKETLDGVLYTILTKSNKLWRSNKAKVERVWASRGDKLWEGNIVGKLMQDKSYFYNVCYADSSHVVPGVIKMSLVIKNHYILLSTGEAAGHLHRRKFRPCL